MMRCLTLASALRDSGAKCHFLCREHIGHQMAKIRDLGFAVHPLPVAPAPLVPDEESPYTAWLGADWETDAKETAAHIRKIRADWLVVDHYAIDIRWETLVNRTVPHCLVIDDLADRPHDCDLLLDQNRSSGDLAYAGLVPPRSVCLEGPEFALLRTEFSRLRKESLLRRRQPGLQNLLISMGGMDADNATGRILDALCTIPLPRPFHISVVMGGNAPHKDAIVSKAQAMEIPVRVLVDAKDMAAHMLAADLAIGAAGTTAWERCCLGLPSLLFLMAENQTVVAERLRRSDAAWIADDPADCREAICSLLAKISDNPSLLSGMSARAASLTDGKGVHHVRQWMQNIHSR